MSYESYEPTQPIRPPGQWRQDQDTPKSAPQGGPESGPGDPAGPTRPSQDPDLPTRPLRDPEPPTRPFQPPAEWRQDQGGPQGGPQGGQQGFQQGVPQGGPQGYQPGVPQGFQQGVSQGGPQGYQQGVPPGGPANVAPPRRRRRHRVRRSVIALFVIIVLAILLVIGNFVGKAVAENDMADQFTANGLPVKPSVDIEGFPFLTQVVAHDFRKVVITASNIPAGPVIISSLHATIIGMHLNSSWNGATIDHLTATAFVSLSSLTDGISTELGGAASLTAVPDGPNTLKVTGTLLGLSTSEEVEIKQTGPQQITIELPTSGLVGSLLGGAASFPINLPAGVPPSLKITGLTLNGQGLTLTATATNATFSK
jgi:LmeA-like phospholipid-binding